MVSLRLDPEVLEQVGELAKKTGWTRSEELRVLIDVALSQENPHLAATLWPDPAKAPAFDHPFTMSAGNYQKCRCGVRELDHR
jgi:hypothetical protein